MKLLSYENQGCYCILTLDHAFKTAPVVGTEGDRCVIGSGSLMQWTGGENPVFCPLFLHLIRGLTVSPLQ